MKIAFFDAKPYDIEAFEEPAKNAGIKLKFYETKLNNRNYVSAYKARRRT